MSVLAYKETTLVPWLPRLAILNNLCLILALPEFLQPLCESILINQGLILSVGLEANPI